MLRRRGNAFEYAEFRPVKSMLELSAGWIRTLPVQNSHVSDAHHQLTSRFSRHPWGESLLFIFERNELHFHQFPLIQFDFQLPAKIFAEARFTNEKRGFQQLPATLEVAEFD